MSLPLTWTETLDRLTVALGGTPQDAAEVHEWLSQALEASWGSTDLAELSRPRRALALQRMSRVVLALEDGDDLTFDVHARVKVAAAFARYWGGIILDGPPWADNPFDNTRPRYDDWLAAASFD